MRIDQDKLNSNVDVVLTNCIVVGFLFILCIMLALYLIISAIVHPPLSHEKENEIISIEWRLATSPSEEYTCFIREGYNEVHCFPFVTRDEN